MEPKGTTLDVVRGRLLDRIDRVHPRVLRLSAGPGWGKSAFARNIAKRVERHAIVSFTGVTDPVDASRRFAAGLDVDDRARALARWSSGDLEVLVLDDVERLARVDAMFIVDEVLARAPADALLVLGSTLGFQIDVASYVGPHEVMTFTRDDLRLTDSERHAVIGADGVAGDLVDRAADLSAGWPIAVLLFRRLAREGLLEEALADLGGPLFTDLHEYMAFALFPELTPVERDAVTVCAVLDAATVDDVSAALGLDARPILAELARRLIYVIHDGETFAIAPLTRGAFRRVRAREATVLLVAGARRLMERGSMLRAAELAIAGGDDVLAGEALDRVGPPTMAAPVVRFLNVARKLSFGVLFDLRWPFVMTFASRPAAAYSDVLFDLVQTYCARLSPDIDARTKFSAKLALAAVTQWTYRTKEALALFRECLKEARGFPDEPERLQMIHAFLAHLLTGEARFREAESHAAAGELERPDCVLAFTFIVSVTLYTKLLYEGRVRELADVHDANLQRATLFRDNVVLAHTLAYFALVAYLSDTMASLPTLVAEVERALGRGPVPSGGGMLRSRYVQSLQPTDLPTHLNCLLAIDAAFAQTDVEVARRLVELAVDGFDRIGQPIGRVVARLAAAMVPGNRADRYLRDAATFLDGTDAVALRDELTSLIAGDERDGPMTAFRRRLREEPLMQTATMIRAQLISETVDRGGVPIILRAREYAVFAALAVARGPVSVEEFLEELWPDADPVAATRALRMTVYRLRKAFGDPEVVGNVRGGYRLSERVAVDVLEGERTVAALGRLPVLAERDRSRLEQLFAQVLSSRASVQSTKWSRMRDAMIGDVRHRVGMLLGQDDLRQQIPERAVETAETLIAFDPLDEPAVELLVRALVASGKAAEARHRYRRYVDVLEAEYRIEPTFTMESLFVRSS